MTFKVIYHEKVEKDIKKLKLSKSQLKKLKHKIEDISHNPFPKQQGGLGEPLSGSLKGLIKFQFDNDDRVIYRLIIDEDFVSIIIIGLRSDHSAYNAVIKRL